MRKHRQNRGKENLPATTKRKNVFSNSQNYRQKQTGTVDILAEINTFTKDDVSKICKTFYDNDGDSSSNSSGGKSEFDEEYYLFSPKPIRLSPSKIVTIDSDNVKTISNNDQILDASKLKRTNDGSFIPYQQSHQENTSKIYTNNTYSLFDMGSSNFISNCTTSGSRISDSEDTNVKETLWKSTETETNSGDSIFTLQNRITSNIPGQASAPFPNFSKNNLTDRMDEIRKLTSKNIAALENWQKFRSNAHSSKKNYTNSTQDRIWNGPNNTTENNCNGFNGSKSTSASATLTLENNTVWKLPRSQTNTDNSFFKKTCGDPRIDTQNIFQSHNGSSKVKQDYNSRSGIHKSENTYTTGYRDIKQGIPQNIAHTNSSQNVTKNVLRKQRNHWTQDDDFRNFIDTESYQNPVQILPPNNSQINNQNILPQTRKVIIPGNRTSNGSQNISDESRKSAQRTTRSNIQDNNNQNENFRTTSPRNSSISTQGLTTHDNSLLCLRNDSTFWQKLWKVFCCGRILRDF